MPIPDDLFCPSCGEVKIQNGTIWMCPSCGTEGLESTGMCPDCGSAMDDLGGGFQQCDDCGLILGEEEVRTPTTLVSYCDTCHVYRDLVFVEDGLACPSCGSSYHPDCLPTEPDHLSFGGCPNCGAAAIFEVRMGSDNAWSVICSRCRSEVSPEDLLPVTQGYLTSWYGADYTGCPICGLSEEDQEEFDPNKDLEICCSNCAYLFVPMKLAIDFCPDNVNVISQEKESDLILVETNEQEHLYYCIRCQKIHRIAFAAHGCGVLCPLSTRGRYGVSFYCRECDEEFFRQEDRDPIPQVTPYWDETGYQSTSRTDDWDDGYSLLLRADKTLAQAEPTAFLVLEDI